MYALSRKKTPVCAGQKQKSPTMRANVAITLFLFAVAAAAFAQSDSTALMMSESLGPFRIGQPASEARGKMRSEPEEGEVMLSQGDGSFHQRVVYPEEGVSFTFVSESRNGRQEVLSVKITAPSKLGTKAGIRRGSTRDEVVAAYRAEANEDMGADDSFFIAGTIEGGISVKFTDGKAEEIYLGPIAE